MMLDSMIQKSQACHRIAGERLALLLADGQRLARDTLSAAIEHRLSNARVDAVRSLDEVIEHLERRPRTDAVIVDWDLPGLDGIADLYRLKAGPWKGRLIVLGSELEDEVGPALLNAGVQGAFSKDIGVAELAERILYVLKGGTSVALPSGVRWLASLRDRHGLSDREAVILKHYLRGAGCPEIAELLGLKEATVSCHLSKIHAKIGIRDALDAYPALRRLTHRGGLDDLLSEALGETA